MELQRDQDFVEKFGKNLRKIRENKNFSQKALADELNTDRSQISRIERGLANPTLETLLSIAQILEVEIIQFFQFE